MYGYDLRLSDDPTDVLHVDTSEPCTDEELEALREFFVAVRAEREGSPKPSAASGHTRGQNGTPA